jgi:hypothetical protein
MTTPRVTEMPLRLEPVQPDPFIDAQSRSTVARPRVTEQQQRERRLELVRRAMRGQAGEGSARRRLS